MVHQQDNDPDTWVPEIGDAVRVIGNSNHHNYRLGAVYHVVKRSEQRTTVTARDPKTGQQGNNLAITDVRPADAIDWFWLKERLPPEDVELLSAFDGLIGLTLKEEARNHLLERMDDLAGAIRRALR